MLFGVGQNGTIHNLNQLGIYYIDFHRWNNHKYRICQKLVIEP